MNPLTAQLPEDIKTAMRAKDTVALNALRALKSAFMNASIEKGNLNIPLDDHEAIAIVRKQIKQRIDSCQQFESAGRPELAITEKAEIEILTRYLPVALTEDEMAAMVESAITELGATSRADMGKVMKRAQELANGRADGKILSACVMKRLP